jgi:hypothetical protein
MEKHTPGVKTPAKRGVFLSGDESLALPQESAWS